MQQVSLFMILSHFQPLKDLARGDLVHIQWVYFTEHREKMHQIGHFLNIKWKLSPFCSAPHLIPPNYWNLFLLSRPHSFIYWQRFHQQKPLGRGDGGSEAAETSHGAPHICLLDNKGT